MRRILSVVVLCLAASVKAHAIVATATGTVVNVSYIEPTDYSDGSSLADLDHTTLYYVVNGSTSVGKVTPAGNAVGGTTIQTSITIPSAAGGFTVATIYATATRTLGMAESAMSDSIVVRIDQRVPKPPK